MTIYISTWMYVESDEDGGIYPQVGGCTATKEAQAIYWRCVYCFFVFARRFIGGNSDIRLALFTNVPVLPAIDDMDLNSELSSLGVEVYCVSYIWRPETRRKQWFNQYYLFDILQVYEKILSNGDCCFVIDSDALIVGDFTPAIAALQKAGALLIDVGVGVEEEVSGLTRLQAADVYKRMTGIGPSEPPPYFGGEFYGLDVETLGKAMDLARTSFPRNNELARAGQLYFSDEAHFFSFLMQQLGYRRSNADRFARRIWTSQRLNNTTHRDLDLCLWHVPSEKLYGIKEIFDDLTSGVLDLSALSDAEIKGYAARKLGVGGFYPHKILGHILRALRRKALTALRTFQLSVGGRRPPTLGWITKLSKHQVN